MNDQDIVDTFNEKARVRAGRVAMMRGGQPPRYGGGYRKAASLVQKGDGPWNPQKSRELFEKQVKEAANVVANENSSEARRTAANRKLNNQDIVDTFNEKARVRAGRVAMMRGGPPPRYGGGHRKASTAASLAQGDSGEHTISYISNPGYYSNNKGDIPVYTDSGIGGEEHYEPYVYNFVKDNIPQVPMWRAGDERHPSLS